MAIITRQQLRDKIVATEPNNAVVANNASTHAELLAESVLVDERLAAAGGPPLPASVRYREEKVGFSWKIEAEDQLSDLKHGPVLPGLKSIHPGDEGTRLQITEHVKGLLVVAGDLKIRELFDPRRIYVVKKSGSDVVYKRTENDKPVLWSFKNSIEISVSLNTEMVPSDKVAKPTATTSQRMTQKVFASWAIANNPGIKKKELVDMLAETFPNDNVGPRHGGHYLSLSKNGKLPEPPDTDPRTWADNE